MTRRLTVGELVAVVRRALGEGNGRLHNAFLRAIMRDADARCAPAPASARRPYFSDDDDDDDDSSDDDGDYAALAAEWADAAPVTSPPALPDGSHLADGRLPVLPAARVCGPAILGLRMDEIARSRGLDAASPAAAHLMGLALRAFCRRMAAARGAPGDGDDGGSLGDI